ncbi:MAG: hypothetical protein GXP16_01535 [Gammaproteobacteria bacterium]|nr:hypothetical protein [Gammaproteobacteria bacterium]
MKTIQELAELIVGHGVGECIELFNANRTSDIYYQMPDKSFSTDAEFFVNDPRVAMAMMEKVRKISVEKWCQLLKQLMHEFDNKNLSRAINAACDEALSDG